MIRVSILIVSLTLGGLLSAPASTADAAPLILKMSSEHPVRAAADFATAADNLRQGVMREASKLHDAYVSVATALGMAGTALSDPRLQELGSQ